MTCLFAFFLRVGILLLLGVALDWAFSIDDLPVCFFFKGRNSLASWGSS